MTDHELQRSLYDYQLPPELVAQEPAAQRDGSRLLVLDRASGARSHRVFADIVEYFHPGDCLVINRTRVVPVRLFGKKETGGKAEVLFLSIHPREDGSYAALIKPFLLPGKKILLPDGLSAEILGKTEKGETLLRLSGGDLVDILSRHGFMPLPPYIKRKDAGKATADRERYQTVYAKDNGSIAAPTAGLHFTDPLLARLREQGVAVAEVVLHVGWGTFKPVVADNIDEHTMLPEHYTIDAAAAAAVNAAREAGKRVFAVGTTSVRSIESAASADGRLSPSSGETSLFIRPGYRFKVVDALVTNFHLPHSTPLFMACAFAGRTTILDAYGEAIERRYRFFSYGDAMLIL